MPRASQAPPGANNRTDLNLPPVPGIPAQGQPNGAPRTSSPSPTQPIQTPTGLPYGEAGQLQQAQAAVPLPAGGAPPPSAGGGPPGDALTAARQFQMPAMPDLHGPTQRPHEPVTAGLPGAVGPQMAPVQNNGIGAMLTRMAQSANSPALAQLAARANSLQQ